MRRRNFEGRERVPGRGAGTGKGMAMGKGRGITIKEFVGGMRKKIMSTYETQNKMDDGQANAKVMEAGWQKFINGQVRRFSHSVGADIGAIRGRVEFAVKMALMKEGETAGKQRAKEFVNMYIVDYFARSDKWGSVCAMAWWHVIKPRGQSA